MTHSDAVETVFGAADEVIGVNTSAALVSAVCQRLRALVPQLHVEEFPDDPEEYQLRHQTGVYLVRYAGATYTKPQSVDEVIQQRRVLIDVVVVTKNLGGAGGTTMWMDVARLALTGFEPAGFLKMAPHTERFEGRKAGQWAYAITFSAPTLTMPLTEDELVAEIASIILNNERDTTEVTSG